MCSKNNGSSADCGIVLRSKSHDRKKARVSKNQWLQLALELFEKQGVNGVKIVQMAKALGIAKSGFYWHFHNRRDLLEKMLEHWEYEYTITVKNLLESKKKLLPEQLLLTIMQVIRKNQLGRYDLAVKSWAETDKLAHEYIQRTYQIRHEILKSIFKALGYKGNELEARIRLFLVYESWNHCVFLEDSDKKLQQLSASLNHKLNQRVIIGNTLFFRKTL